MIRPRRSTRPDRRPARLGPILERLEGRALMAFAGSLNPAFGTGGMYVTPPIDQAVYGGLSGVAVESDGTIVASGVIGPATSPNYGLLELTSAGAPVTSFGTNGEAALPLPTGATDANLCRTSR